MTVVGWLDPQPDGTVVVVTEKGVSVISFTAVDVQAFLDQMGAPVDETIEIDGSYE